MYFAVPWVLGWCCFTPMVISALVTCRCGYSWRHPHRPTGPTGPTGPTNVPPPRLCRPLRLSRTGGQSTPRGLFSGGNAVLPGWSCAGVPGDDNRLCGFLPPEPPSFPEVPWADGLIEPPLLKLQRLRSASVAGFTRGLMLGNASPVQKFFARPVAVVNRFAPTLPARSRATRSRPVGRVSGWGVLWRACLDRCGLLASLAA